jgi:predicted ATPase
MAESLEHFSTIPAEYQNVLRLAQDKFNIEVIPLMELKGGRTGAYLFLVSVSLLQSSKVQHLILKLDHKSERSKADELERHSLAIKEAPPEFAHNHIAGLAFERIELNEAVVIFYSIAGQSLHNYKSLANYQRQNKLEKIFEKTNKLLLSGWNKTSKFEKAVHPQQIIAGWLGYRLQPGGNIEQFMEDSCKIPNDIPGLMFHGHVFPNPFNYSRKIELWEKARPIDTIIGFQHGDLNVSNILVKFNESDNEIIGYYLIDFALFKSGMPLFYDLRYLEVSYLIRELSRVSLSKWVDMVIHFAEKDIIDPHLVPIELSGACSVINSGRKAFGSWVDEFYPSLSDDMWGQSWLAAVAVGLNYCNKTAISEKERLAGLIFAAAYLKRYHSVFGVPLPVEVKYLNIISEPWNTEDMNIRTLDHAVPKHNLPSESTPFIGREKELKTITELLQREDVRLVNLTGPGGTGKTRLALQSVRDLIDNFKDGVYFIDLSTDREPESVLASIAGTIGLRETSSRPLIEEFKTKLQKKKLLFLLDNFEQVTSAAPKLGELLHVCPKLKLLVTSRETLHLRGEYVFPVPPLGLPDTNFKKQSLEQFTQFEAVRLFIDRALAVKPDFEVTNENAPAVAEICIRLDGLPLAIELAASRISIFSPKALLERIEGRLKLLRGGARDLPARQQTLRSTIDWSYELLDKYEKQLFVLLSVFSGFNFESVENTAGRIKQLDEKGLDILDELISLIDKSLIRREDQNREGSRLLMLETIREYAAERLNENSEFASNARRAHADYFAEFTQNLWDLLIGPERDSTLEKIEPDIENMKIAWRYWISEGNLEQLHKLTNTLWLIYDAKGWYNASIGLTSDLLNVLASNPSTPARARLEIMLQTSLARALMAIKGCTPEVENAYTNALELCKKYGEIPQSYPILRALAGFYAYIADFKKSAEFGKQILELAKEVNDVNMEVDGCLVYGYNLVFMGNPKQGLEYLEKGIANYNPEIRDSHSFRFGNNQGVTSHTTSALCRWMIGFPDRALKLAEAAITLANKLNHPFNVAYALFHTCLLHLWRQEIEIVLKLSNAVLDIAEKHEFPIWKAVATCMHGSALSAMGQTEKGLAEFKQGIDMYAELKTPPVFWPILLILKAGTHIQSGQSKVGLELIDEALKTIGEHTTNPLLAEVLRIKGDVLLLVSPENHNEAESLFIKSLNISRKQETLMFELHAAMSLNRLWQQKGKIEEGQQILREAYNKFTEGFTTADLMEAKKMLAD